MDAESRISSINFIEGLPDMTSLDPTKDNLLIIDDLMHDMNEVVAKLFTKGSHHRNGDSYQISRRHSPHIGHKLLCKLCRPLPPQQWRIRPCGPARWLALLLIKAGDAETNPGPTTTSLDLR